MLAKCKSINNLNIEFVIPQALNHKPPNMACLRKKIGKVNLLIPFLYSLLQSQIDFFFFFFFNTSGNNCIKTICVFGLRWRVKVYPPKVFLWKVRETRGLEQRPSCSSAKLKPSVLQRVNGLINTMGCWLFFNTFSHINLFSVAGMFVLFFICLLLFVWTNHHLSKSLFALPCLLFMKHLAMVTSQA